MDLVTVLTTPRTPSYLQDTLESLNKAGAGDCARLLVCDGVLTGPTHLGWDVFETGAKQGNLRAFFAVLARAYERGAERLLYFEDDICCSVNAVAQMRKVGVPSDCAWTAFFDMKEVAEGTPRGLYRTSPGGVDGQGWWGFQSVMIPKRTLIWLLSRKKEILREAGEVLHCSDFFAGHAMLRSPWPEVAIHVPSLVQHVGANTSSIWPGEGQYEVNRVAQNFLGVFEDALQDVETPRGRVAATGEFLLPGQARRVPSGGVWKGLDIPARTRIQRLLLEVRAKGFLRAPLLQEDGTFTFIPGDVHLPPHPVWDDRVLESAARLIARLHLQCDVSHGDLAPWNTVFADGLPSALIDFEHASEGAAPEDAAYALWTWLDLGNSVLSASVQQRRAVAMIKYWQWPSEGIRQALFRVFQTYEQHADEQTRNWAQTAREWCDKEEFLK